VTIRIRGARQNNLQNLDLDLPTGQLVVVTGVSGSGKSSLVFDTLYAEGQRRYVETFSSYARQFLDRMDKPAVDSIEGIPPAIAIDQTNPVRTSRSTVGTMTELNDHLKLLYARAATLHCAGCGQQVRRDTPDTIADDVAARAPQLGDARVLVCFHVDVPQNFKASEVRGLLEAQGYTRIRGSEPGRIEVVQDRLRCDGLDRGRLIESLEAALRLGRGRVQLHVLADTAAARARETADAAPAAQTLRYSSDLHCADCDRAYAVPTPSAFSFNSPVGACETCRGFGRVIGVDYGLVIPDTSKTLRDGAIRPWQTESFRENQDDLERCAKRHGIPLDTPWRDLPAAARQWVIDGEAGRGRDRWYGTKGFFAWLESKAYKMHIRVLLSKYRSYTPCGSCDGARLKGESLLWRLGDAGAASQALGTTPRFKPRGVTWSDAVLAALPGLSLHDLMLLPAERARAFFAALRLPGALDEATDLLLGEIRARFAYLCDVGLGYLTLDRQSRTLSGGEVQRINLTTALGTSLVNTLFVLDEPSIGLHPRDMQRVIGVMRRLRDAGNSLVVVEHDPQIMLQADRLIDMGPGAGERGGRIVCDGTPADVRSSPASLTGQYLSGVKRVELPANIEPGSGRRGAPGAQDRWLELLGAREHNLQDVDLRVPLGRLVCLTGVSGSGKSTLMQDVLWPALQQARGKPTESPGVHRALRGIESLGDAVFVDQTPIGRTTRSNPASYVGAFDVIRELYAKLPLARERGYKPGTFSCNSGTGRCATCGGNGFEHVEMQFLSDVYLRCGDCDGRRYRAETLEVTTRGANGREASIADVLEMTVTEALEFFGDLPELRARLAPLAEVGLDYLKLGQPVPTLSGGEAQRLKLAGHLADTGAKPTLFLFDEPTTGLHFDDIAKLLRAFRRLIDAGHSLLVIEHNLDVIRAAEWLVDLGPEGGEGGGRIVAEGTPAALRANAASHTGRALADYEQSFTTAWQVAEPALTPAATLPSARAARNAIVVHHAREHNLRNVDVEIPRDAFTVITGVSGSGKSTLAFDIIFNEGQRRYLESLNAYARQFVQPASRPDVDAVTGIPPTVAIEQRTSRGGRKSTVATLTEIHHFLRLLFVKLGTQHCPDCAVAIEPRSEAAIVDAILKRYRGRSVQLLAPLVVARKGLYTELARWARAKGYESLRVDGKPTPTRPWPRLDRYREHSIELPVATLTASAKHEAALREAVATALGHGKGVLQVLTAGATEAEVYSSRRACPSCGQGFAELDPRLFSFNSRQGWCTSCYGTGVEVESIDEEQNLENAAWSARIADDAAVCETCDGRRLNPVALNVRLGGRSIAEFSCEPVAGVGSLLDALKLDTRAAAIARDVLVELRARLGFLERVGLGYLELDRAAPTLSGGEAQRIRLAAQLGSNLQGVCYVLDEPTIGLHPRDNRVLLDALGLLAAQRNTLIVVEHDEDTIRRADHVIDLGPGAGVQGGRVVGAGRVGELIANPESLTGRYLREPLRHPREPRRAVDARTPSLTIHGAKLHNLRGVDVRVPLGRLVVVTGVSGSGKSTLARDILHDSVRSLLGKRGSPVGCARIAGIEQLDRVLEVDQTPIGKTPRSCPATYVGAWDHVRKLFAAAPDARLRGYGAGRFSFNTAGGRCEACEGQGVRTIEMSFLPDVKVLCDSCGGRRFNSETLAVAWNGRSIGDVVAMSITEAVGFFRAHPTLHHMFRLLEEVGLGYLTLGQQSPTLSGGEAQRLKLVTELAKVHPEAQRRAGTRAPRTLYVLDEPTVGLHMADVEKLLGVLQRLVDAGNSVVLIEHNLDLIAAADWIIDMGPEAGAGGGQLVAEGTPQSLARAAARRSPRSRRGTVSHTGVALAEFLATRTLE
jgi:excinuclease ABC subunit A